MEETPQTAKSVVWSTCEVLGKGVRRLQKALRHGSNRLCEIDEEWARLRRKSAMLDEDISKIKIGVTQAGSTNMQIRELGLARSSLVLERAVTLLSWLRLHQ